MEAFTSNYDGSLQSVLLNRVVDWSESSSGKTIKVSILDPNQGGAIIGEGLVSGEFLAKEDVRGEAVTVQFSPPLQIKKSQQYFIQIELSAGEGQIGISGSRPALETTWDDPLPLGLDGYNPFDYYSGSYRTDLNFEMYWDDTADKLIRFETTLDQADYLFLTSGRQWGTLPRVPERFPLTTEYYRALLGCPTEKDVVWCYRVAQPGMFEGQLGFELVSVTQSDPNLGNLKFNSQFAEEAFTVYDAPKVMIFQKTFAYSRKSVADLLGSVDLTKIIKVTPGGSSKSVGTLLLPEDQLEVQRAGGTWSELFNWDALINRSQFLTVVFWYLFIALLGWVIFPFTRLAMGGLADKGYALSRLVGMVVFAWLAWISGSLGLTVSRGLLLAAFGIILLLGLGIAWMTRKELVEEIRANWRHYLRLEALGLLFFLIFLAVRLGNPDLWHPYKGGEKPMDFSYFNAVLKSSTFPPYDPWFAGGYINYYYYGFVLVGMPVKLLGIVPSVAYNLILPTLFSLLGMGAFSVGFSLVHGAQPANLSERIEASAKWQVRWKSFWTVLRKKQAANQVESVSVTENMPNHALRNAWLGGIAAAAGMVLLGNLGSVRMVWHGLMRIAAPGGTIDPSSFFQRFGWTFQGFFKYLAGTPLPYPPGDWYWIPSRVYSGEPITEFPLFTFLYADLHAHMMAIVLTGLAIAWTLSVLLKKWQWKAGLRGWLEFGCTMVLGGLVVGALRPTNTWDFPTYLILAGLVIFYTGFRYGQLSKSFLPNLGHDLRRLILSAGAAVLFTGLAFLFYQPFAHWYGQAYTALDFYKGDRSAFWSYITHWGLFLFILLSWFIQESVDWMTKTPASHLKVLKPYKILIQFLAILLLLAIVFLTLQKIFIGWLVLTMAAWALVLMLRPGLSDAKRLALFMSGTALTVTLVVELVTLRGDLGRMNTVFKFYLQAWSMFAVSSGAALIWLIPEINKIRKLVWKTAWMIGLVILVGGTAWFPLLAGNDKIKDRIASTAPHTLDGMTYMEYSTYNDQGVELDLSQDYRAIRWMQENVKGSPVIVEGNAPEYRWGTRFTIYTGLPGVVGWNWHQRQQRAVLAVDWVWPRVDEINAFYSGINPTDAQSFLEKYDVRYIIVGQMERVYYPAEGLAKFEDLNGVYWKEVYREQNTVVYEVIQK
jgi:YYY domain-containing protein